MPPTKKPKKKYTNEDVLGAVSKIKNKQLTYRRASQIYRIPFGTLSDKVNFILLSLFR